MEAYIVLAFSLALAAGFIIYSETGRNVNVRIILKGIASLGFIALGITAVLISNVPIRYKAVLLTGLVLGACGDMILAFKEKFPQYTNILIASGIGSFLLGHIFYIIYFNFFTNFNSWITVIALTIFLAATLLLNLTGCKFRKMLVPTLIYTLVISLMMAYGLWNLNLKSGFKILIAIAVVLFGVSDIILSYIYFHPKKLKGTISANLTAYYLAQNFLALSLVLLNI